MNKRLGIVLLSMLGSVCTLASETCVENSDGVKIWYEFDSKTKTARVTHEGKRFRSWDNKYTGDVVIPSKVTYEGVEYDVTSIGNRAFSACFNLTNVTIPESVT